MSVSSLRHEEFSAYDNIALEDDAVLKSVLPSSVVFLHMDQYELKDDLKLEVVRAR